MITIPATNLQHISDFGLLTIITDIDRYSEETLVHAERTLEGRYNGSMVLWNGKEVVVAGSSFNCPEGLSF